MFELDCDGERASWLAYIRVTAERFAALMAPFFSVPYLTKNRETR